jgi:FlaA1/EpsC-like NDP-sugar epimerase
MSAPPAERLLGRPEFAGDLRRAGAWLTGRRVLVTGAAGSIGQPLTHALARLEPAGLILVDHHEYSLFGLERSLATTDSRADVRLELADVRHRPTLTRLFEQTRPDVVIHLAAAKHVPYGERFPLVAVAVNVLATAHLLELGAALGVGTFVFPSSDKSVDPPSLYGATKRVAEALVQHAAADRRHWYLVRYVNIIGTRGSVIETFTDQIVADEPLTVTDERMTRYWISMAEALWLLLGANPIGPGVIAMPECGEAVPVVETARRLAAWYRPDRDPYPIRLRGVRPGERLHEALLSPRESFAEGPAAGIRTVRSSRDPACLDRVTELVGHLRALVDEGDAQRVHALTIGAARELQ